MACPFPVSAIPTLRQLTPLRQTRIEHACAASFVVVAEESWPVAEVPEALVLAWLRMDGNGCSDAVLRKTLAEDIGEGSALDSTSCRCWAEPFAGQELVAVSVRARKISENAINS